MAGIEPSTLRVEPTTLTTANKLKLWDEIGGQKIFTGHSSEPSSTFEI